jgi:hypothetical protein
MQQLVASSISHPFRQLSQSEGQITHVLLTRSPLEYPQKGLSARLACVKHAASVRPEPGSNSPSKNNRKPNPAKKRSTSKQSPRIIVHQLKKKPPPQPTKNQPWQRDHTNQFIDKHTVEFSKIRRAPKQPLSRCLGGNLRKLTGPAPEASNQIGMPSCRSPRPTRRTAGNVVGGDIIQRTRRDQRSLHPLPWVRRSTRAPRGGTGRTRVPATPRPRAGRAPEGLPGRPSTPYPPATRHRRAARRRCAARRPPRR